MNATMGWVDGWMGDMIDGWMDGFCTLFWIRQSGKCELLVFINRRSVRGEAALVLRRSGLEQCAEAEGGVHPSPGV